MNVRESLAIAFVLTLGATLPTAPAVAQNRAAIQGTVVTSDSAGNATALAGIAVSLRCGNAAASGSAVTLLSTVTDGSGSFSFQDLEGGRCVVDSEAGQFEREQVAVDVTPGQIQEIALQLKLRTVQQIALVTADQTNVIDTTTSSTAPPPLDEKTLDSAPTVTAAYQEALPLVPGVVRGPDGLINIKGGRGDQGSTLVNSITGTDPATGQDAVSLPLDAVRSVTVLTNPFSAEYGGFSSGVTSVETRSGTDKWKFMVYNFLPRPRRRAGTIMGIASATPRVTVAGPLLKDKLYLFQSVDYRFERTSVPTLPPLQHDQSFESFDSSTQLDWTPSGNHHISSNFLWYPENVRYALLNTFMPEATNPDFRRRGFLASVSDRAVFGKSLLESSLSVKRYDAHIFPASGSLGELVDYPEQNFGSWFDRQDRNSWMGQWSETWHAASFKARGDHDLLIGSSLIHQDADGRVANTSVLVEREDHSRSQLIAFSKPMQLDANDTLLSFFVQDHWTLRRRFALDLGVRADHDALSNDTIDVAPRAGFVTALTRDNKTVLRGGAGLFYDKIPLDVSTFRRYPSETVTQYAADGVTLAGPPVVYEHQIASPAMRLPYSIGWQLQVERQLPHGFIARAGYDERHTRHDFFLEPVQNQSGASALQLWNTGGDSWRDFEGTLRWQPRTRTQIFTSYVHSEARGNLNGFQQYFGDFPNPILRPNQYGVLPHDVPDRVITWGSIGLPWKLELWPVLDIHNGFAWSPVDSNLNFVGTRDSRRFPEFASLDMQVLRPVQIPIFGGEHSARIGVKVFNVTKHFNPRDVQDNISSSEYGKFYNSMGRQFGGKLEFNF